MVKFFSGLFLGREIPKGAFFESKRILYSM